MYIRMQAFDQLLRCRQGLQSQIDSVRGDLVEQACVHIDAIERVGATETELGVL
ncbi:Uncharacterised protein [Mycobacteroides abscessus subsp. abscessus]|nr:Uncharacterised protein [Mycobacteroides abscessus subsp. abscessus]